MPQTLSHIEWCLNKARKELKEGKKHRGLVKIKPNIHDMEYKIHHYYQKYL